MGFLLVFLRLRSLALFALALVLALSASPASASAETASLTYPVDGATKVDTTQPFTWTAVAGAHQYYLYVGRTQGAKDLVDTGGTQATAWTIPPLPDNSFLWARIWTEQNNIWTYKDAKFTAASRVASFTYPQDGAAAVDPAQPFAWAAIDKAQAYSLSIGTSQGAKDLLNTGSTQATSWGVSRLPTNQKLWARISTETGGFWRYQDISFTATTPSRAEFTYPTSGSAAVKTRPFSWTSVPGVKGYYLYVGTTQGAKDVVDSFLTPATSYSVPPLPVGQTLWARIWTYTAAGSWLYSDISFQVSAGAARLTYPDSSTTPTRIDTRKPFTWTSPSDSQAYQLLIGSSPGASDLGKSNGTTATSWNPPALPIGKKVYARLLTEHNGNWDSWVDSSFTVAYSYASLSYPKQNQAQVDMSRPLSWSPVSGADSYRVWIGNSQGASDLGQSGETTDTTYAPGPLPVGAHLWARLWTKSSGDWIYGSDVQFSPGPVITAPAQRSVTVDRTRPVSWVPGAVLNGKQPTYQLTIGSTPSGNDLFDSGVTSSTSLTVPASGMPADKPLFARVIYRLGDGTQRRADVVFATADSTFAPSKLIWGGAGSGSFDAGQPFQWNANAVAQAYELQILDANSATVADSGAINVPRYFDVALARGTYTARLGTRIGGSWSWTTEPFTVTANGSSATNEIAAAQWAADFVRHMSDDQDYAYQWSGLNDVLTTTDGFVKAECGHFASEMLTILGQMNVTGQRPASQQPQRFTTYFDYNPGDGHVAVKFWNADDQDWIMIDPYFDLAATRSADRHWATVEDIHQATLAKDWSAITYVALGDHGFGFARSNYLDYPLLFLNTNRQAAEIDPTSYATSLGPPPLANGWKLYVVTSDQKPVTLLSDGNPFMPTFQSPSGFSTAFWGGKLELPAGSTAHVTVWAPNRYVF